MIHVWCIFSSLVIATCSARSQNCNSCYSDEQTFCKVHIQDANIFIQNFSHLLQKHHCSSGGSSILLCSYPHSMPGQLPSRACHRYCEYQTAEANGKASYHLQS